MNDHALKTLEYEAIRQLLANEAASGLGQEKAVSMRPEDNLVIVQTRLDETAQARKMLSVKGNIPLGGIMDIRALLQQASVGATLSAPDLQDVAGTVASGRSLKAFLAKAGNEDYPLLSAYGNQIGVYTQIEEEVGRAIGSTGQVLDSASPELARIRSRKRTAESRLREKMNAIISGPLRTYLQDPVIVQRGDRSCVPVRAEHRGAFGGIVHDVSASGATLFIEPASVVELGNEVRELDIKEEQEVARILAKLSALVARNVDSIVATLEVLAELDFIVARAHLADRQHAVEPSLNANGVTRLLSVRHPLIDPERVVPVDIILGEANNKILLITGPNTGGKTVSLKTLGLLTLMAQSGLHVPASRADMNVFSQVFADIGDEQSIQQSLSTFSGHITSIARMLKALGRNALVLLDEVGAGTDPAEGAALAHAILEYLRQKDARVVATSHYGELKAYAFVTPGVQNASVEFDEKTLQPTYRLMQGIPGSSHALAIAERLGLPNEVVALANEELLGGSDESTDMIRELESARRSALSDSAAAERARRDAESIKNRAEQELTELESLRREVRQKAMEEARAAIRKAQQKADNILAELRETREQVRAESARQELRDIEHDVADEIETLLNLPQEVEEPESFEPDRPLRSGDQVRVASLGLVGTLLADVRDDEKVPVQVGSLRVMVPPSTLRLSAQRPARKTSPQPEPALMATRHGSMVAANVSPQITLLGQRADEAIRSVEKYLDDAYGAGLRRARIVHGKGTGALRRAVQERLREHPLVEEFTTADADEGGAGATVVTLKE
jgi:DNA mismatch repair protein MutS2